MKRLFAASMQILWCEEAKLLYALTLSQSGAQTTLSSQLHLESNILAELTSILMDTFKALKCHSHRNAKARSAQLPGSCLAR